MINIADVTGGRPIAVSSQSISGVNVVIFNAISNLISGGEIEYLL
jgi:hypothetical protein